MKFVLFLAVFLFLLGGSQGNHTWYDSCNRLVTCGGFVPVGYPFWGGKWRPKECGYPHLKISCEDGLTPTIMIEGMEYVVVFVNELDWVIDVARKDYYSQGVCLKTFANTSLNWNEFRYSPITQNLTVLYGCKPPKSRVMEQFSCKIKGIRRDIGYYVDGIVNPVDYDCNLSVVVPTVLIPDVGLKMIFQDGFMLNYTLQNQNDVEFCRICEGAPSNGSCGYDNSRNRTVCLCPHGTEDIKCNIFNSTAIPPTQGKQVKHGKHVKWEIVLVAASTGAALLLIAATILSWWWWTRNKAPPRETLFHDVPLFEWSTLLTATNHFSLANKLGQGGFGPVYKGVLADGREIAVKRLQRASGKDQFLNEVDSISKLQHNNLVRLLGCCTEGEERLLVYEFMANNSLDSILFDPEASKTLFWEKRFDIILGICRGLLYLHRDSRVKIIHRDLKTGNILLDGDLNPKISDFGTAKIFDRNQDQDKTQTIVGTRGYMSPEYVRGGDYSEKSDVYSLGVMVLEIVSGRRNRSFQDEDAPGVVAYAWKLWQSQDVISLIDPAVFRPSFELQILNCIHVALLCVQEHAADRPSMADIASMLENEDIRSLPPPKPPLSPEDSPRHDEGSTSASVNIISLTTLSAK